MGLRFQGNGVHSQLYSFVEEEVWRTRMESVIIIHQAQTLQQLS